MPSKTYNSNHLRRLSWPTLINPNVFIYKSNTMNFNQNSLKTESKNYKEIRIIKLNSRHHQLKSSNNSTTIVDNVFRSIRNRKLKHPINCFNRKNVKLQYLLTYPSDNNYLDILKKSSLNSCQSQSANDLTDLDLKESNNSLANQHLLKRSRSEIDNFEFSKMELLKAIRNSVDSNRLSKLTTEEDDRTSFNNLIKLDELCRQEKEWKALNTLESLENAGIRLFGYKDSQHISTNNKTQFTKDKQSQKELNTKELITKEFKQFISIDQPFKTTADQLKQLDNRLMLENRIEELLNSTLKDDLKDNELFSSTNLDNNLLNYDNLSFPVGKLDKVDCEICFQECSLHRRICCDYAACSNCLSQYFQERVSLGSFSIECINNKCHSPVNRNEISLSLEPKYKEIYHNLLRVNNDLGKLTRTCPNCNNLHKLKDNSELKKMRKNRKKDPLVSRVKCEECDISWCFLCHSPWHTNITCKQFIAGDRLLRDWAKQFNGGQVNAQKCPSCKAFIQRISGCDHMHCSNCETDFCYKCGEKLLRLKFFGNHYSKLSIFGCKYRYKPNQPVLRKTVRFIVLCSKLAAAPVCCSALVGALLVAIGVGSLALPIYGLLRFTRFVVEKRSHKRNQSKLNSLRPISKQDIDSNFLNTPKFDIDLNSQQFLPFNIAQSDESPLRHATFTQNQNWLANYYLMTDLNNTPGSTNFTNFSNFSSDEFKNFNNSIPIDSKSTKHRKHQLIF